MAKRGDPEVLRLLVVWLRSIPKWTQAIFAEACGVRQSDISRYENGIEAPSEEVLRRMAKAVKVPWPVVVQVRRVFAAARGLVDLETQKETLATPDLGEVWREVMTLALTSYFIEGTGDRAPVSVEDLRRDALEIWRVLAPHPAERRLALLRAYPGDRGRWEALVERICMESVHAAADDPQEARQHAEFALAAANQASLKSGDRVLVLAYVWGFIGNARRVANEFQEARQAFLEVERLLKAGEGHTTELLDLDRLLDLEASLRKDEQRYPEALVLLDRAREAASEDKAIGHILLNKEHVLERMGDHEGALAVLAEAEPYIRRSGDARLLLAFHFNRADNLYHLERYETGASLMSVIRELVAEKGNGLDLLRVRWLGGRIDAGLGKEDEAVAALEEVKEAFTMRRLPYDAALSMLDLALLLLKRGDVSRVEELALETAWIFDAHGIRREALAALKLFCETAEKRLLNAGLVRRVRAEVERYR